MLFNPGEDTLQDEAFPYLIITPWTRKQECEEVPFSKTFYVLRRLFTFVFLALFPAICNLCFLFGKNISVNFGLSENAGEDINRALCQNRSPVLGPSILQSKRQISFFSSWEWHNIRGSQFDCHVCLQLPKNFLLITLRISWKKNLLSLGTTRDKFKIYVPQNLCTPK